MKRRVTVLFLSLMMALSISVPSFAATDGDPGSKVKVPEAVALVTVENIDCILLNEIGDELNVKISFKNGDSIAEIPVIRVKEAGEDMVALWLGEKPEREITDAVKKSMKTLQTEFHLGSYKELKAIFESADEKEIEKYIEDLAKELENIFSNYEVELIGLPERDGHEFKTESGTMIMTNELVNEFIGIFKDMIGDAFGWSAAELGQINSLSSLIKKFESELIKAGIMKKGQDLISFAEEFMEMKFTEEEKAQIKDELDKIDATLSYMKSEDYSGTVITGVYVTCGCPFKVEYEIVHQYFKEVNGKMKLIGTVNYAPNDGFYVGFSGDTVKASDYIRCRYKGETYKYIGSYNSYIEMEPEEVAEYYNNEEWWEEDALDEYVLDEDDPYAPLGLLLRYEIRASSASSPETGDNSSMLPYIITLVLSLAAMAVTIGFRRGSRRT